MWLPPTGRHRPPRSPTGPRCRRPARPAGPGRAASPCACAEGTALPPGNCSPHPPGEAARVPLLWSSATGRKARGASGWRGGVGREPRVRERGGCGCPRRRPPAPGTRPPRPPGAHRPQDVQEVSGAGPAAPARLGLGGRREGGGRRAGAGPASPVPRGSALLARAQRCARGTGMVRPCSGAARERPAPLPAGPRGLLGAQGSPSALPSGCWPGLFGYLLVKNLKSKLSH